VKKREGKYSNLFKKKNINSKYTEREKSEISGGRS
jgi:hypothetical protein